MNVLLLFPLFQGKLDRFVSACQRNGWTLTVLDRKGSGMRYDRAVSAVVETDVVSENPEPYLALLEGSRFDAVVPFTEFSVVVAERLAARLGLPHNDLSKAEAFRNKRLQRALLSYAGVEQPTVLHVVRNVLSNSDLAFLGTLPYPVVVKPVDCAGSINVRFCNTPHETAKAIETALDVDSISGGAVFQKEVLVEEAVLGPEYSHEVVVCRGKIVFSMNTAKFVSPLPACDEVGHLMPAALDTAAKKALIENASRIADGFGFRNGVMHIEHKMRGSSPSVIEVGFRLAGGAIPEMIEIHTGHCLEEILIRLRAGEDVLLGDSRPQIESSHVGVKFHFEATRNIVIPDGLRLVEAYLRHQPGRGKVEGTHLFGRLGFTIVESSDPKAIANYIRGTPVPS
jgi:biotin carboxylase